MGQGILKRKEGGSQSLYKVNMLKAPSPFVECYISWFSKLLVFVSEVGGGCLSSI